MRHLRPVCARCIYWVAESAAGTATIGLCHRFPPSVFALAETGTIVQKMPTTDHHQWCGEWSDDDSRFLDAVRRTVMDNAHRT